MYLCDTSLFDHIHKVPPQLLGLTRMKQWSGVLQQMMQTINLEICHVMPCNKTCDIFPKLILYCSLFQLHAYQLEQYLHLFWYIKVSLYLLLYHYLLAHLGNGHSICFGECQWHCQCNLPVQTSFCGEVGFWICLKHLSAEGCLHDSPRFKWC